MKYKVKLKNIEMTKAEIYFEVRPAVSILPPLTQMTDICKFGIDLLLFFNPPPSSSIDLPGLD